MTTLMAFPRAPVACFGWSSQCVARLLSTLFYTFMFSGMLTTSFRGVRGAFPEDDLEGTLE